MSRLGTLGGPPSGLLCRLRRWALISYLVFGAGSLIFAGFWAFLGLTCSALVVMISHLWLEGSLIVCSGRDRPRIHGGSGFTSWRGL